MRSLLNFLCMLPMAVAQSSSGRVIQTQGERAILGVSSPMTMHCNMFAANNVIQYQNGPFRHCRGEGGDVSAQHGRSDLQLPCYVLIFGISPLVTMIR